MPKLILPISDLDQLVTRPIVVQMLNQIKRETQLPADAIIWFPGEDGSTLQPQSTITGDQNFMSQEGSNQLNRMGTNSQITVEVQEEFDNAFTLTGPLFKPENLFIFKDPALGIFMKPNYRRTNVTLQIHYRAQSATQAANWRNLMQQRISGQADVRLYDLTYSFYVLPTYLTILRELYRLREKVAGYGDTFDQYLKGHLIEKATQITDLAGKTENLRWAIPETQIRVPGYWDFDGFPEKGTRDEKSGTWTATVAFQFAYDRPSTQVMFYPLMIHNQLLGKKWRPDMTSWEKTHANPGYSLTAHSLRAFEGNLNHVPNTATEGYRIPWFDEFVPDGIIPQTRNVVQALVSIDPLNPRALFSLKDMGAFVLDPDIQAFLVGEAPYLNQVGQSVFSLVLYRGSTMMPDGTLAIDSDLNVSTPLTLDLRHVYHIRLALHYDLCGISPSAQQRLQRHCEAARKIIDALDGRIKFRPGLPICSSTDVMSRQDYVTMNARINARTSRNSQANSYLGSFYGTVATLFVDERSEARLSVEQAQARTLERQRLMECLSARATYPNPVEAQLDRETAIREVIEENEDIFSTGEEIDSSGEPDLCSS